MIRRAGGATVAVVTATVLLAACSAPVGDASESAPPWPAPTDLATRADAAGLRNVWGEPLAEHVHTHLTVLDGDRDVTVPADVGHSDRGRFAAELHTHDESGIVHVESPTDETFTLGQFFDEWGVSLGPSHVGGLHGELFVWVDGQRRIGNPRTIALSDRREVVLQVVSVGELPHRPEPFDWPSQY